VSDTKKPEECERCSHPTRKLNFYDKTLPDMRPRWLCRICEVTPGHETVALHPALNLILEAASRREPGK
jgi:hypothetical protein